MRGKKTVSKKQKQRSQRSGARNCVSTSAKPRGSAPTRRRWLEQVLLYLGALYSPVKDAFWGLRSRITPHQPKIQTQTQVGSSSAGGGSGDLSFVMSGQDVAMKALFAHHERIKWATYDAAMTTTSSAFVSNPKSRSAPPSG
jgi:hypothetical protein